LTITTNLEILYTSNYLHRQQLACNSYLFCTKLGHSMKPRSITWSSNSFDKLQWCALVPKLSNENTWYMLVILVEVHITCVLYRLTQRCNLVVCSNLFIVGQSIVSLVIKQIITTINLTFNKLIYWPTWPIWKQLCTWLQTFVGFANIHGAIINTNFFISKLDGHFNEDYYYHEIIRHSLVCKIIVGDNFFY
jgi:hypothetical protein